MKKWDEMSTNQIVVEVVEMKEKHEALKRNIIQLYDELEKVEKNFIEANKIIKERLGK